MRQHIDTGDNIKHSALITFITGVAAIFTLPQDDVSGEGSLDLLGCSVGFTGLILFDVAWK